MTDPLDACRERWRGTIRLTDTHLREALRRDCGPDGVSMLGAEILRLRAENERLGNELLVQVFGRSEQFGRELWLACWMIGATNATLGVIWNLVCEGEL